jgi:hypothetical protein
MRTIPLLHSHYFHSLIDVVSIIVVVDVVVPTGT